MAREAELGRGAHAMARGDMLTWSPQRALDGMDRNRIRTAIASISTPGVWFGDAKEAASLARAWNEYAAGQMQAHPGRFGLFAVLPMPDIDGALREMEYALDVLKADGVGLFTNYGGKYPGDEAFAEFYAELDRRGAIAYFHPIGPAYPAPIPGLLPQVIEFAFDTTRAIVSLLTSGTASRLKNIRWIFSHAGGAVPMLAGRLRHTLRRPPFPERMPDGVFTELRRMHFDIAGASSTGSLAALRDLVPPTQILYGSDTPFVNAESGLAEMAETPFTPAELELIEYRNAQRLMPRLAT